MWRVEGLGGWVVFVGERDVDGVCFVGCGLGWGFLGGFW